MGSKGLARQFDPVKNDTHKHGWWFVAPVFGIFTAGSPNVFVNSRAAIREGDGGLHIICPGTNSFKATSGADKTLINSKRAVRNGDRTQHCDDFTSPGEVLGGFTSPNTFADQ